MNCAFCTIINNIDKTIYFRVVSLSLKVCKKIEECALKLRFDNLIYLLIAVQMYFPTR